MGDQINSNPSIKLVDLGVAEVRVRDLAGSLCFRLEAFSASLHPIVLTDINVSGRKPDEMLGILSL